MDLNAHPFSGPPRRGSAFHHFSTAALAVLAAAGIVCGACSSGESSPSLSTAAATNTPTTQPVVADVPLDDGRIKHTVLKGESLTDIAERYDVTLVQLIEENYHIIDPPQSVIDFFERIHAGEGCMFYAGNVIIIPAPE